MRTVLATALACAALLLLPQPAAACAVCGPGFEETRVAFLVTTGLLTATPLLLVGGVLFWLRRRIRAMEERSREERGEATPAL